MILDRYEIKAGEKLLTFEFLSEGKNGKVLKVVQFQPMNIPDLFNLAFGDKDLQTGQIDDMVVTDNGDSDKVLATVVATVYAFVNEYPNSWIYATGSTAARTRLYRMGINKYYHIVVNDFVLMGLQHNEWEPYEFGKSYQAFAVHKKTNTFEL
ncbi:MAG: hypothetical protein MUF24_02820 [Chitinophagaceae bacterium]|jgi:hypothetical protein|nr:hypothetical protein [Chitinophagaceae bacterium]